jgi:hypothetical protein
MDSTGRLNETEREGITIPSTSTVAEEAIPAAMAMRRKKEGRILNMKKVAKRQCSRWRIVYFLICFVESLVEEIDVILCWIDQPSIKTCQVAISSAKDWIS